MVSRYGAEAVEAAAAAREPRVPCEGVPETWRLPLHPAASAARGAAGFGMIAAPRDPPRYGEGDRAKRGGGGSAPIQRPVVYAARRPRREMTLPEAMLWQLLRKRPGGLKFRRQHPVEPYIVDFCCREASLIIEIDGSAHGLGDRPERDHLRDARLKDRGFAVLRGPAIDVLHDAESVVAYILAWVGNPLHQPAAGPPPRSGEE